MRFAEVAVAAADSSAVDSAGVVDSAVLPGTARSVAACAIYFENERFFSVYHILISAHVHFTASRQRKSGNSLRARSSIAARGPGWLFLFEFHSSRRLTQKPAFASAFI